MTAGSRRNASVRFAGAVAARTAGVALVLLLAGATPAAAAPVSPAPSTPTSSSPTSSSPTSSSPASSSPAPSTPASSSTLVVTGVQPSVGAVEFFLAGRALPAGASLAAVPLTVTAGDVTLDATVRELGGGTASSPASAVVLVVDTSGSMAGDRISAARAAARAYAAAAPPSVHLGLVTVADRPSVVLRPTADRAAFTAAVTRLAARGGTALYDGIAAAQNVFQGGADEFVERRVVVLSDGADTTSRTEPEHLLIDLADAPATVDAVAFGAAADRARLTELCATTGGQVQDAHDRDGLSSVFRTMAAGLSAPVLVSAVVPPELAGRTALLRVEADLGGGAVVAADTSVGFRPDPRAGGAPTVFTVAATGSSGFFVVLAVVAVAAFGLALLVLYPATGRGHVRRRLGELDAFTAGGSAGAAAAAGGGHVLRAALAVSERAVSKPDRRERIELSLDRAGLNLRAAEWQLIRAACGIGGALLLVLLLPWWAGLVLGALGGWAGAAGYLRLRAGRRTRAFAVQLPEALQLVVGSLRSGFSLAQSIDALVREGADPVAGELGRALAETRLGGDLEDALDRVGQRNASQDMAWLVMAIRIQREVGGSLSEVLETAVATMRERARLGRHVRALSAEGRLSALILLAMPVLLGGWMFAFRRDYVEPLYTQPLGIVMLAVSVVMVGVGALWLRKIVQVRV